MASETMSNRTRAQIQHEINEQHRKTFCGTCKYHRREDAQWICGNEISDYFSDYTDYDDYCEDWEERNENYRIND